MKTRWLGTMMAAGLLCGGHLMAEHSVKATASHSTSTETRTGKIKETKEIKKALASLSREQKEIALLPFELPSAGVKEITCRTVGYARQTVTDLGSVRIAIADQPYGGESSSSVPLEMSPGSRSSTRSGSFKLESADGVTNFDYRGIKWSIKDGILLVADKELKIVDPIRKIIYLDKTGKFLAYVELPEDEKEQP